VFPPELGTEVVHKARVKVLTAQVEVTGDSLDLEDTALNGQKGNVECTTTKIEDEDVFLRFELLVETVSDCGCGGLIDGAEDIETCNYTSVLGGLSL
jgi:hypothetical protein